MPYFHLAISASSHCILLKFKCHKQIIRKCYRILAHLKQILVHSSSRNEIFKVSHRRYATYTFQKLHPDRIITNSASSFEGFIFGQKLPTILKWCVLCTSSVIEWFNCCLLLCFVNNGHICRWRSHRTGALRTVFQFTVKHQLSLSNNSISSQSIIKMESYFSWTEALSVYQGWPQCQSE